jgi:hypothetical protein
MGQRAECKCFDESVLQINAGSAVVGGLWVTEYILGQKSGRHVIESTSIQSPSRAVSIGLNFS